jgi:hypothetical protein
MPRDIVVELVHPWQPAGAEGPDLATELEVEVAPGHPLHDRRCRAIARRVDRDEVLFATSGADPRVFVVSLTGSGHREAPPLPEAVAFPSLGDWFAELRRGGG